MSATTSDVKSIFGKAMEIDSSAERAAYLDQACADNAALRAEVEALLGALNQATGFMQQPAAAQAIGAADEIAERPGVMIGPYRLVEEIGAGGMGLVFVAEQQEPVRRQVALKVIKPGMDTREVIARFEQERQTLALMDHPNIAKVFDGGTTGPNPKSESRNPKQIRSTKSENQNQAEAQVSDIRDSDFGFVSDFDIRDSDFASGRPYFVMELVKGVPITTYCDESALTPRQRLELFLPICHAVQHAHQKGIIHRDLKPSNILVSSHDGVPVPKVIDFGIAKAIGEQLTENSVYTRLTQMVGTPLYMSPEQAGMSGLDIDTRTDIYSLGVLLYELLTGTTPFDQRRLHKAGFDEIRRIIREEEPPKPSTRLSELRKTVDPSQTVVAEEADRPTETSGLTAISARRQIEPAKLSKLLRGDLDWIVMKCMEKDRTRRYQTAHELELDLRRYLADEPVSAGPPSVGYRARKFVRRNRGPVIAASLVLVALVGGIVGTSLGMIEAYRGRDAAEFARGKAEKSETAALAAAAAEQKAKHTAERREAGTLAMLDFLESRILAPPRPEGELGGLGRDVSLRQAVAAALPSVEKDFLDHPLLEARLRTTLGLTFHHLGEEQVAADQFERARALLAEFSGPEHPDTLRSMTNLANMYEALGRPADALTLREETLRLQKTKLGPNDADTLKSMNNLANSYDDFLRDAEALKLRQETLALRQATLGNHADTFSTMHNLANSYRSLGQYDKALKLHAETLALRQANLGPRNSATLMSMESLAGTQRDAGLYAEAAKLHAETWELRKAQLGPNHPSTLLSMTQLADSYASLGRYAEAAKLHEETLKLRKLAKLDERTDTLASMNNLAAGYAALGRHADALKIHEETLALRQAKFGLEHRDTLASMVNLASSYAGVGRHADAIQLGEKTLAVLKAKLGPDHPHTLVSMHNLAVSYAAFGRRSDAVKLYQETLALRKATLGDDHPLTLSTMNNLGNVYAALHRFADALKLREETLRLRKAKLGQDHPDTLVSMHGLAMSYAEVNRHADAVKLYEETLPLRKDKLGADDAGTLHTMRNLANEYAILNRHTDALKLHKETLARREAKLGPDDPATLESMADVAGDYGRLGKYADAIQITEKTLPRLKAKLGNDDQLTLICLHNLGIFYAGLQRHAEAAKIREETLTLRKAKLGPDHLDTLQSMRELTSSYLALDRFAEALKLSQGSLALYRAKFGPDQDDTLRSMFDVAKCLVKLKRGAEAVPVIDDLVERSVRLGAPPITISSILALRTEHFARIKDTAGCRITAEMWEKLAHKDGVSLYNAGCMRAVTAAVILDRDKSPAAAKDAAAEADRAMVWLKQAVAAGFTDVAQYRRDPDLDSLRNRDDFKKLIAELEARKIPKEK